MDELSIVIIHLSLAIYHCCDEIYSDFAFGNDANDSGDTVSNIQCTKMQYLILDLYSYILCEFALFVLKHLLFYCIGSTSIQLKCENF